MNTIKDITDFLFLGKSLEELSHYDLLIINADWAEEQLAKDMKLMLDKNIINDNTLFIICESEDSYFVDEKCRTSRSSGRNRDVKRRNG